GGVEAEGAGAQRADAGTGSHGAPHHRDRAKGADAAEDAPGIYGCRTAGDTAIHSQGAGINRGGTGVAAGVGENPLAGAILDDPGDATGLTNARGKGVRSGVAAGEGERAVGSIFEEVGGGGRGEAEGRRGCR